MKMLKFLVLVALYLTVVACGDTSNNNSGKSAQNSALEETTASTNTVDPNNSNNKQIESMTFESAKDCQLSMGWAAWEPYQYRARDGTETGLDIDIARATQKELGCTIKFQQGDWAELLILLKDGELDSVASAAMTESRREYAYFSEPYRSESFSIYVREDELEKYSGQSIRALLDSGVRIGAVSGYSYGVTIGDYETDPKYQQQFSYNEISEENFGKLFDLKLDAVLEDPFVGSDMIRRKGWNTRVAKLPLVIHSGDVHFMFSKKSVSDEVVQKMNSALAKLKADGSYRRLLELYGGQ